MSHTEFVGIMAQMHPDIEVLSEFEYAKDPIKCRCQKCGYEWKAKPLNLTYKKNPTGCPNCNGHKKKTTEMFREELARIHPEIDVLGEYVTSHAPVSVKCTRHDYVFDAIPTNILRRSATGCQKCAKMSNDSRLAYDLKRYCIQNFEGAVAEYRVIRNPATGKWLPYDIYIPDINGEQVFCEVMGQQHYTYYPYVHGVYENFVRQIERDNYKEMYANSVGRYVEIDIRKIKSIEDALPLIMGENMGWIHRKALDLKSACVPENAIIAAYGSNTPQIAKGSLNLYRNMEDQ